MTLYPPVRAVKLFWPFFIIFFEAGKVRRKHFFGETPPALTFGGRLTGAHGLHRAGVIDMRRLQEYEALCNPVPKFTGEDVKELRESMEDGYACPSVVDVIPGD